MFRRRGVEHEFEILAEAEIEHLVGFVEHDDRQRGDVERAALEMIAQPPRRADDDVARPLARLRRSRCASMPPTQADDARTGMAVEPGQLALHLHRQLARRRDDQRQRRAGRRQSGSASPSSVAAMARP